MARAEAGRKPIIKTLPEEFAGICGVYWEGHAGYEVSEATCGTQHEGAFGNLCPVYVCAREREVGHCGICPDFPCLLLVNMAAHGGPEDRRIDSAALRAALGDERWAEWARERQLWRSAFCPLWRRQQHG